MPYKTGNAKIDTLLTDFQPHWNGNGTFEEGTTLTFSFVTSISAYNAVAEVDIPLGAFLAFSAAQKQVARDVLKSWANVADIKFTEVTDLQTSHGNIRFANDMSIGSGTLGLTFLPDVTPGGPKNDFEVGGDVYINHLLSENFLLGEHGYGRAVMVHEAGHALGLTHPNDFDSLGTIPASQNTDRFSVMVTPETAGVNVFEDAGVFATGPMLYDILAIQHLYGKNMTFHTGNDTYAFNDSSLVYETIWDAGGSDTISVSGSNQRAIINLNAGTFSSVVESPAGSGAATNNLAIAFGVTIENANGGNKNDVITGNNANNRLLGNAGNDRLSGGNGNDSLVGGTGLDTLSGGNGNDKLLGDASNDSLSGGAGNDSLTGGTGNDRLDGGTGNDSFFVDSSGDVVVEAAGAGIDRIISTASRTMPANLENLSLTGAANVNATGSNLANSIAGNSGRNTLNGLDGNDILNGGAGNDSLNGGNGNDSLDGGAGIDRMVGGAGNDTYRMDVASDVAVESAGQGTDRVFTSVSDTLAANVENLFLTGAAAINGTGNTSANTIVGNDANNTLIGLAGNDTLDGRGGNDRLDGGTGDDRMIGGAGNDIYIVDSAADIAVEGAGAGTDEVRSTVTVGALAADVENLALQGAADIDGTGNELANRLAGNTGVNVLAGLDGDDSLSGLGGNDVLEGGAGLDALTGGDGADAFVFRALADGSAVATNVVRDAVAGDTIIDFDALASDSLRFLASVFDPLGDIPLGFLADGDSFSSIGAAYDGTNAGTNANHTAGEASFVFSTADATLYYDADGVGAGYTVLATFSNAAPVTAADIEIVAA